jgi:hypothetical protein
MLTLSEAKKIIGTKLAEAVNALPESERIPVDFPKSVSEYKLNHPNAAYLIVYGGGQFNKAKSPGVIYQDRDIKIGVISVVRKQELGKQPEEYVEFAIEALSGLEIDEFSGRADRKVYVESDEWIDEEQGIWRYIVTFIVPTEFLEKSQRGE